MIGFIVACSVSGPSATTQPSSASPTQIAKPTALPAQTVTATPSPTPTDPPSPLPTRTPYPPSETEFLLTVDSPPFQWVGDMIDAGVHLTYTGAQPEVTVWGPASGLASVGFENRSEGLQMWSQPEGLCTPYVLKADQPLSIPIDKSATWQLADGNRGFYNNWLADPELHFPTGPWHVDAAAQFFAKTGWDRCAWDQTGPRGELIQMFQSDWFAVTPQPPIPMPAEGCHGAPLSEDVPTPSSLIVDGDVELDLTMIGGVSRRDGSGASDIDYGAWQVDLPRQPFRVAAGAAISVAGAPGVQLIDADTYRYAAEKFVVNEWGERLATGKLLGNPRVLFPDDGTLRVVTPNLDGDWVIRVHVAWLTPCLSGDGEVNFGVETR